MWPFNWCLAEGDSAEREPLLPQHEPQDTVAQRLVRDKLRLHFVRKAFRAGYMPSTEQLVGNLRALSAADFLNPKHSRLGPSGQLFLKDLTRCIDQLITLLLEKNADDALQDIIWLLPKQGDTIRSDIAVAEAGVQDAMKGGLAFSTLVLTNPELRLFLKDISSIGRLMVSDGGGSFASAAAQVTAKDKQLEQADQGQPSQESQVQTAEDAKAQELADGMSRFQNEAEAAIDSVTEQLTGAATSIVHSEGKRALLKRIKDTIGELRKQDDYDATVAAITESIKNYGTEQGQAIEEGGSSSNAASNREFGNNELKLTVSKIWDFFRKFGDVHEWERLEELLCDLSDKLKPDPHYSDFREVVAEFVHHLLTDPEFVDTIELSIEDFRAKLEAQGAKPDTLKSLDALLHQLSVTMESACEDKTVMELFATLTTLRRRISMGYRDPESTLLSDIQQVVIPLLLRHFQIIPLERLEISVPEVDLLLENVMLQPAWTTSSFLPANTLVTIQNDISLKKIHAKRAETRFRTKATITTTGNNARATDLGFWIQVHPASLLPSFVDTGIASFQLDERGIDITLDLEIARGTKDQFLLLHGVRVVIHKLDYTLQAGYKWFTIWWLLKPFLKHMIRRLLEKKIAEEMVNLVKNLNRRILLARNCLRDSEKFDMNDAMRVLRALTVRFDADPESEEGTATDQYRPGVFAGRHTPGGAVQIWKDETQRAIHESGDRWRSAVFNAIVVPTQAPVGAQMSGGPVSTETVI
ncbi:hypothetical protein KEM56_002154 [Ascosphaera pollenicola]|nr:hypothetical protein KEM56_002154 [Ascosphaera pollenicola]